MLRTLGAHERARRFVLDRFRQLGGKLDRWRERSVREAMAAALTHAEDAVEFDGVGKVRPNDAADRVALRAIRRRLESELHP